MLFEIQAENRSEVLRAGEKRRKEGRWEIKKGSKILMKGVIFRIWVKKR